MEISNPTPASKDMIREFKPHRKQENFLQIPDSIFEGLYGGAAGGGKSDLLLLLPLLRGFTSNPNFRGIFLRRTYPELESEIIPRSQKWFPLAGGRYKDQKRRWEFPEGGIFYFGHAEHEEDIRKYDTAQYNYTAWDELTSFLNFQYSYLSYS